jgi:hypothetical protein
MESIRVMAAHRIGAKLPAAFLALAGLLLDASGSRPAHAATPPATVNYQGVLRDATDHPLSGTYDVVFRFMDAASAGNEIMVDQHTAANSNAVAVAIGLFNVALGSGTVSDGSGPGTYTSLDAVFRDYTNVWLEVRVGGETLSPRTPIQSAAYALNATDLAGHPDSFFLNTSTATQEKDGELDVFNGAPTGNGVVAQGAGIAVRGDAGVTGVGGYFTGSTGLSSACSGSGCVGLLSYAPVGEAIDAAGAVGGHFETWTGLVTTDIATDSRGIEAHGGNIGGNFQTFVQNSSGIRAQGQAYGGFFTTGSSTGAFAAVHADAYTYGVESSGGTAGGLFTNGNGTSATLANPSYGVQGHGLTAGGYFTDASGNSATLAGGGMGISASSATNVGAYFSNGAPNYAYTQIPYNNLGIWAYGSDYGGQFNAFSTGNFAQLAYSSYKILGTGVVSFVQNHPDDPYKVIVYVAPEGDEAAVYTRGSGRLVNGEARVPLGETFALVANPDIGLTATATPRGGEPIPLVVSELSPGEVVVRGPAGSNADFDYMVWGLRIGFEDQSIVQPKKEESKIPSMHFHEKFFQDDPGLRRYTALARFQGVEEKVHGRKNVDHARADRLRDAVGVFPYRDPEGLAREPGRPGVITPAPSAPSPVTAEAPSSHSAPGASLEPAGPAGLRADAPGAGSAVVAGLDLFTPEGVIETGDVVSLAPDAPGSVTRSAGPGDALVVGCAQIGSNDIPAAASAAGSPAAQGEVTVATSHMGLCRVDATLGAIAVGDRLSPSPVPGVAMKIDPEVAGTTLLGRAIDPLPSGVGLIRVLLSVR